MENKICGCTIPYGKCCGRKVTSKNLEEKILEAVEAYELRWSKMSEFDKWVIREINKQIDQGVAQSGQSSRLGRGMS